MAGLIAFDHGAEKDLDPVIAAAVLAFGFVYIHPFEDGNGRIHRYLMHHVLARRGFNPAGLHFPVSAAILDRITEYRSVLESYSSRLLPCVQWEATQRGNVKVLNDTADFYRFFDATPHAEFLYECVRQTIEQDLPNEANFLRNFDRFRIGIENMIDCRNVRSTNCLVFSGKIKEDFRSGRKKANSLSLPWTKFRRLSSCLQTRSAKADQQVTDAGSRPCVVNFHAPASARL